MAFIEIDSIKHIVRAIYNETDKKIIVDFPKSMPMYR